jgi:hypothetical protein
LSKLPVFLMSSILPGVFSAHDRNRQVGKNGKDFRLDSPEKALDTDDAEP